MSTRSNIAVVHPGTKKVMAVYCHYDGYVEGVGVELMNHFNSTAMASELIRRGGMRSIENGEADYYGDEPVMLYEDAESFVDDVASDIEFVYIYDKGWSVIDQYSGEIADLQRAIDNSPVEVEVNGEDLIPLF